MKHITMDDMGQKFKESNKSDSFFSECIDIVLRNEGGYSNNSLDPGGETNFGICKKYYPEIDIKNLTREKAIDIYYCDYWLKMNLNNIYDENLVLQIFDCGVNCGISTAIKMIQKIVEVTIDGDMGVETEMAIKDYFIADLVDLYKQERKKYYFNLVRKNPELAIFLKGWMNRVEKTLFA